MKTNFTTLFILLLSCFSFSGKSQCSVKINPQGPLTFCEGDEVVLNATGTGGGLTLDQSQLIYNGGTSARTLSGYSYWQSFTAGITGTMSRIDIGFFNYINGTGYLTIFKGSGTGGQRLDSLVVPVICPFNRDTLMPFFINIPVTAGSVYTFQFRAGPGIPDPYGLMIDAGNSYAAGQMAFVDPSGTYFPGFDIVFKTYVGSGLYYHWSTGSTDTSITVAASGNYVVTVTDSAGCTKLDSVTVTVNPAPPTPIITQSHDTLFCSTYPSYTAYQWYDSTTLIPGATGTFVVITHATNYNIRVTNEYGCYTAVGINVVPVGINPFTVYGLQFTVAPNPVREELRIKNSASGIEKIEIFNFLGEVLKIEEEKLGKEISVDVKDIPAGIYFVRVSTDKGSRIAKFVKD